MRKTALVIVFVVSCIVSGYSQKWIIGGKAGFTIPELRSPDDPGELNKGYKSIIGPHFGLTFERKFNKLFSLQAELNYSVGGAIRSGNQRFKGSAFNGASTTPPPQYLYASFDNTVRMRYVDLPIMAKFSLPIGLKSRISIMGGGFVSYLTYAHVILEGKGKIYKDAEHTEEYISNEIEVYKDSSIINDCNRLNYGIAGGLSYSRRLVAGWELSITGSGMYGFANLQKDERHGKNKTGAAVVSLGIAKHF